MEYLIGKNIKPTYTKAGAISVYENLFQNWKEIIDGVENEASNPNSGATYNLATTTDGRWDGARRNKILLLTDAAKKGNEFCRTVHNFIGLTLDEALLEYVQRYDTGFSSHEWYQFLKYEGATNDHYDAHYDGGPATGRWISAIIYLNDDYEGGEIDFVDHDFKLKPKAGTLVIFPSNYAYRHIAHPVTKGTKYAIVTWIADA